MQQMTLSSYVPTFAEKYLMKKTVGEAAHALFGPLVLSFFVFIFFAITIPSFMSSTLNFSFYYAFYFFLSMVGLIIILDFVYIFKISHATISKKMFFINKSIKILAILLILFNPFMLYTGSDRIDYTYDSAPEFFLQLSDIADIDDYDESRLESYRYYDSTLYYISQEAISIDGTISYEMTIRYYVFETDIKAEKRFQMVAKERGDNLSGTEYDFDFDVISFGIRNYYILKDNVIIVFSLSTDEQEKQYILSALELLSLRITDNNI